MQQTGYPAKKAEGGDHVGLAKINSVENGMDLNGGSYEVTRKGSCRWWRVRGRVDIVRPNPTWVFGRSDVRADTIDRWLYLARCGATRHFCSIT